MTQIIHGRAVARQLDERANAEVEPEPSQDGSDFPLIPVQSSVSDKVVRFSSGPSLFQDLGTEDFYFQSEIP